MKILVTGGSGFVGTHLINRLAEEHETVNLDIRSPPQPNKADTFIKCDITDYNSLKKTFESDLKDIDAIYHLAGLSRESESNKFPETYNRTNVNGTFNVIDASRFTSSKKFIFASTFLVYGEPVYLPIDENHPKDPKSIYASTKLCGETICNAHQEIYGVKTVKFRKSIIYGEDDLEKRIVSLFIDKAKSGKDLTVFGNKFLDFVYIEDVISAYISALKKDVTGDFNIGTGEKVTLLDLANMVRDIVNPGVKVVEDGLRTGEIKGYNPDISKARKLLDFNPQQDLISFIKRCI
ncbi:MAG: NAD-dependent epimerase/dehydratase family protein [Candidatus Aenigmarchaeota archaeon]|nr:NAD-dependent epimerase/dehydratase family protein [Candidatus Aenigmarchaeota archaeon]